MSNVDLITTSDSGGRWLDRFEYLGTEYQIMPGEGMEFWEGHCKLKVWDQGRARTLTIRDNFGTVVPLEYVGTWEYAFGY